MNVVKVQFMTPHEPRITFLWPNRDDICWIPKKHILRILQTLSATSTGCSYKLQDIDFTALAELC